MKTALLAIFAFALAAQVRIPGPGGSGGTSAPCTPGSGYAHCRLLTADHTQVGGSTLSSFPMAVVVTLGSGRIQNVNCYDVVFSSDARGRTLIPWEIESCDQGSGAIVAWVEVSSLSYSSDTTVYVSYDNASITTAQNTSSLAPAQIWSAANLVSVIHDPSNNVDSAGLNTVTVNSVASTTGELDGAGTFDGATSYDSTGVTSLPTGAGAAVTVSTWFKASALSAVEILAGRWDGGPPVLLDWVLDWQPGVGFVFDYRDTAHLQFIASGGSQSTGVWYYLVGTYDGASGHSLYVNNSVTTSASSFDAGAPGFTSYVIGQSTHDSFAAGVLDEVRVASVGRTAGWVTAEYNNQKPGSTFVTVGAEN